MKNHFWRIEYSITIIVIFAIILFLIPTSFTSKEAGYISIWNEKYNKIEYTFTAMTAQANSEIVKEFKEARSDDEREELMIKLMQPYLRLEVFDNEHDRYKQHFMNGKTVAKKDYYNMDKLYISESDLIVGIKDVQEKDILAPVFILMVDVNGKKSPNRWGKDIYGVNIFVDGKIKALGYDKDVEELRKDCQDKGSGVYCSYYYRIGGDFRE